MNHINTWKGGRKSNASRVSWDLRGSVTWEHTNMCHLATQLSQMDTWLNYVYFPVYHRTFFFHICNPITVIVWSPMLIWDEIHGNAPMNAPSPAVVRPAGQWCISYSAIAASSSVRWVGRVAPDIPFIRVGVVDFAGKSGKHKRQRWKCNAKF